MSKRTIGRHPVAVEIEDDDFAKATPFPVPTGRSSKERSAPFISATERINQAVARKCVESHFFGVKVLFPFQPYQSQMTMMSTIIKCLNSATSSHALIESPTGTGKTMSLLCAVLAWQLDCRQRLIGSADAAIEKCTASEIAINLRPPKVYYTSRTHKQLSQAISELRRCPYLPKMTVLSSRSRYCLNKKALQEHDVNQACSNLLKGLTLDGSGSDAIGKQKKPKGGTTCSFFSRYSRLASAMGGCVHDVEELLDQGRDLNACPYYASRDIALDAELVFAPYNYLIDPSIRDSVGIDLEGAIVIIDEAHNVEDTSRDSGSFKITKDELDVIINELLSLLHHTKFDSSIFVPESKGGDQDMQYIAEHASVLTFVKILAGFVAGCTNFDVEEFDRRLKVYRDKAIVDLLNSIAINETTFPEHYSAFTTLYEANTRDQRGGGGKDAGNPLEDRLLSVGSCRILQKIFQIVHYVLLEGKACAQDYVMVISQIERQQLASNRRKSHGGREIVTELSFWLQNPGAIFTALSKKCKSVILTSGSLAPLQSFQSELQTIFSEVVEAPHVIEPTQFWVGVIGRAPGGALLNGTFKSSESYEYQDGLGEVILRVVESTPFGVLCFVPSFNFMEKLLSRWKSIGVLDRIQAKKEVFTEGKNSSAGEDFDQTLDEYYKFITAVESGKSTKTGAVFFAVFRGKASEGINFNDNFARVVVAVGIPYPNFKDTQIVMKKRYNDQFGSSKHLISGNEWYEIQAYRALNQALGRCIRHRNDWGAILLIDSRFSDARARRPISRWIRDQIQPTNSAASFDQTFGSLLQFFSTKKAATPKGLLHSEPESVLVASLAPNRLISLYCLYCGTFLVRTMNGNFKVVSEDICAPITAKRVSRVNPHAWKNPIFRSSIWQTCSVDSSQVVCLSGCDAALPYSSQLAPSEGHNRKFEVYECQKCREKKLSTSNILYCSDEKAPNVVYFLPETICWRIDSSENVVKL